MSQKRTKTFKKLLAFFIVFSMLIQYIPINATENDTNDTLSVSYVEKEGTEAVIAEDKPAENESIATKQLEELGTVKNPKKVAERLFASPPGPIELDGIPRQGDGSNIESIAAKWITEDTVNNNDDSFLYQKPTNDEEQTVILQINYALSGEHDYNPGDITITIPKNIFKKRNGKEAGTIIIPYAEDPSTQNDFNWKQIDDTYVLTNTKPMSAATKGYIQFAFHELIPHELVDMEVSDAFDAVIEVVTHRGNTIGLRSNALTAQFDTEAIVTDVNKEVFGTPYRVDKSKIPEEQRIPGEEEYIKVDWYIRGETKANTEYTLTSKDTIPNEYQGFIIGSDNPREFEETLFEGHKSGKTSYYQYSTAYPASQFEPDVEYTFHNTVEFTVTEKDPAATVVNPNVSNEDPKKVTHVSDPAEVTFSWHLPIWIKPPGHFMVVKNGNDDTPGNNITHKNGEESSDLHLWSKDCNGWYGIYPSGVNQLQDEYQNKGEDSGIYLSYTINSIGYSMPWMFEESSYNTDHELAPRKTVNYTRPVSMTTTDTGFSIDRHGDKLKVNTDYDFVGVEFPDTPWVYTGVPNNINPDGSWKAVTAGDGTFLYNKDDDVKHIPDIKLEIQKNDTWQEFATVSYRSGKKVITLKSGETISGDRVVFPTGTQNFRTKVVMQNDNSVENKVIQAAIDYDIRPVIFLHSTKKMNTLIEKLFSKNNTPQMEIWNSTEMIAEREDTLKPGEEKQLVNLFDDGYDILNGYTTDIQVYPHKSAKQTIKDIDQVKQSVTIHYSADIEEMSLIYDKKTYEEAIADGKILPETHGIWRDLLPKGVVPVMDSITLRDGDSIENAYTIENYKKSGRTLLVVEANLKNTPEKKRVGDMTYYADIPSIKFDATYDFESIVDYGDELHNVISFESSNPYIGTVEDYSGEPDDTDSTNNIATPKAFENNKEKTAMNNLNPGRTDPAFVYAGVNTKLNVISAAKTSLSKDVMVNNDGWWSTGLYYNNPEANKRTVYEGGFYSYRLRMMSDADTISKDLILYDSLENFYAGDGNDDIDIDSPHWQGTLLDVDMSQLEEMGCKPVLYYSTVENLQLSDETNPQQAHATNVKLNSPVWVKADDYTGELKDVKAIAVDASKKEDGSDFILDSGQSVIVIVNMRAPSGEPARRYISQKGIWGDSAHAYNNIYLLCTSIDKRTMISDGDNFIRKDYTKIGLMEHEIKVKKVWDDDENRDGIRPESIKVKLFADGEDTGKTLTLPHEGKWEASFTNVPYTDPYGRKIQYSIKEDSINGYSSNIRGTDPIQINNKHIPETISISGTKTWENDNEELRPESIIVELYKNGEYYKRKTISSSNNWKYTFDNLYKYENGQEINYTLKELSDDKKLQSYKGEVNGYNIKNTYHPYGDLICSKTVNNATEISKNQEFTFTFEFTKDDKPIFNEYDYDILNEENEVISSGKISNNGTVKLKGGQKVKVKEIDEYADYKITESQEEGFHLVNSQDTSGTIIPNSGNSASFTNKYSAKGTFQLGAKKQLNYQNIIRALFQYELYEVKDNEETLYKITSNGNRDKAVEDETPYSTAPISFPTIRYTEADHGKTFIYKLKEKNTGKQYYDYDDTVYTIEVSVQDKGDGEMEVTPVFKKGNDTVSQNELLFSNTYHAEGDITLKAWKELKGRDLQNEEFSFTLYDDKGNIIPTKKNNADGEVTFDSIHYTEKDIGKTYYYYIKENTGTDPSVNYSKETYGYKVDVLDNGDGTLTFSQGKAKPIMGYPEEDNSSKIKYAVSLYGIEVDTNQNGDTMGLTFGPALGKNYIKSYTSHTPNGKTTNGNTHRCIHDDDWATIIAWNNIDPYVYEQCITNKCSHSVLLDTTKTDTVLNKNFDDSYITGDGPSALYYELMQNDSNKENLRWHPHTNRPNDSSTFSGTNYEGWGASKTRAMLNGADELTDIGDDSNQITGDYYSTRASSDVNKSASIYSDSNCLFASFPKELQENIGNRTTKYDSVYNNKIEENLKITFDKLWLLSTEEICDNPDHTNFNHPLEGDTYKYFVGSGTYDNTIGNGRRKGFRANGIWVEDTFKVNSSFDPVCWLRSASWANSNVCEISTTGRIANSGASYDESISFAFALNRTIKKKPKTEEELQDYIDSIGGREKIIVGWETENVSDPEFHNTLNPGSLSIGKSAIDATSDVERQKFRFKVKLIGDDIPDGNINYNVQDNKPIIKYSHTPNISDDGTQNGNYDNSLNLIDVVSIPGADKLKITITYGGENERWDYACIWEGNHPEYTAANNNSSSVTGKLGGGNHTSASNTQTFTIDGDTATIGYRSDSSQCGDGYGYYAVIQGLDSSGYYVCKNIAPIKSAQSKKENNNILSKVLDFIDPSVTVHAATISSGTCGTCSWEIDENGKLKIYPTNNTSGTLDETTTQNRPPWYNDRLSINSVEIVNEVKANPTSYFLFADLENCKEMDLSGLNTSNMTNMDSMFKNCKSLTSLDLSNFNTNNVIGMHHMFEECNNLSSLNLSSFTTSNVTNMAYMFSKCSKLSSLDLSNFDTSQVTAMNQMFYQCEELTSLDISNFDTSNVLNMMSLFCKCRKLTSLDLSHFKTSKTVDMSYMFCDCDNLISLNFSPTFDTSSVRNMSQMFDGCDNLKTLDVSNFNTSNVTTMYAMFRSCPFTSLDLSNFDTSKVTNMYNMFYTCRELTSLNISNFDTSKVTNMEGMFCDCRKLTNLDVSKFNTENVTTMYTMFMRCHSDVIDVSHFNTSKVTDFGRMFYGCTGITSLDVSHFNTDKARDMEYMFYYCPNISSLDVSNFNTENVTDMQYMFASCEALSSLDVSNFNTNKVTDTHYMFNDCSSLTSLDLSNFDTSKVTNMKSMLTDCTKLEEINIGKNFKFKGNSITDVEKQALLTTPDTSKSTGKWIREDETVPAKTPEELRDNYDANANLWAGTWIWEPLPPNYNLIYSAPDASGGSMANESVPAAEDKTLTNNTYFKRGNVFDHWEDGRGNIYQNGDVIPANTYEALDTITLTAVFAPKTGTATIENGEFIITLEADEKAIIDDLPAGTKYQIYEETEKGWTLVNSSNTSGEIQALQTSKANFVNKYNPDETSIQLRATKLLDNKEVSEGFSFALMEGSTTLQTKEVSEGGLVLFDPIVYNSEGNHTYKIKEVNMNNPNITYDTHEETVFVHVAKEDDLLSATATYDGDGAVFKNNTKKTTLNIKKTGTPITTANQNDVFYFKVTINGEEQTVSCKAGQTVTVSDVPIGASYTVEEINLPAGWEGDEKQSGTITNNHEITFVNHYKAKGSVSFTVYKQMDIGDLDGGEYQFTLTGNGANQTITNGTTALDGLAPVNFGEIKYTEADIGQTYEYTITEEAPDDPTIIHDSSPIHVSVHITDAGGGKLHVEETYENDKQTFTNHHKKATLQITKNILSAPDNHMEDSFQFKLHLPEGNYPAVKYKDTDVLDNLTVKDGDVIDLKHNERISITELDAESEYSVEEMEKANWILDSSTNAEGSLEAGEIKTAVFHNRYIDVYRAQGTAQILANKDINRGTLDESFTFELLDKNDEVIERKHVDNPSGSSSPITFTPIDYTEEDIGKTFYYTIKETKGEDESIAYDTKEYPVEVSVSDKEDGSLKCDVRYVSYNGEEKQYSEAPPTFHNYRAGSLRLEKNLISEYDIAPDTSFDFIITLDDPTHTGNEKIVFNNDDFKDNVAHVSVFANSFIVLDGIPAGMTYTIKEEPKNGYLFLSSTHETGTISDTLSTAVFNNQYNGVYSEVKKVWDDENDPLRPEYIEVQLYGNNVLINNYTVLSDGREIQVTDGKVRLDNSNNWTVKALDLDKTHGSETIKYQWKEIIPSDSILATDYETEYQHSLE